MTIIMIEATAEELQANRTVMDNVNAVLNKFTDRLCGVHNIDYRKALAADWGEEKGEEQCE